MDDKQREKEDKRPEGMMTKLITEIFALIVSFFAFGTVLGTAMGMLISSEFVDNEEGLY